MRVVHIVLDPPGLKGIQKRHEGGCTNNVFYKVIFAEAAMPAVMTNDKELHDKHTTVLMPEGEASALVQAKKGWQWLELLRERR